MRALLDVNVLIALLDANHSLHVRATAWFREHAQLGWASCPITQNGWLRIMCHPGYPNSLPATAVAERLAEATATSLHEFWADDITLLDPGLVSLEQVHGPRQLTDVYLLALAARNGGRFVTFDKAIAQETVVSAKAMHLLVL